MFSGLDVAHQNPARRWTTLVSFFAQASLVIVALVVPLFRPQYLTEAFANRRIFVPASNGEAPPQPDRVAPHPGVAERRDILVVSRSTHPLTFGKAQPATAVSAPEPPRLDSTIGTGGPGPGLWADANSVVVPRPPAPAATRRISAIMEGNLIRRVEPQYPAIAKQLHIQGTVVVRALISRDGSIEQAQPISGQGILSAAAVAAIRQWKYRPYYLNNEPIEVETEITVNFILAH